MESTVRLWMSSKPKNIVVDWALSSLHGESLEITSTITLHKEYSSFNC